MDILGMLGKLFGGGVLSTVAGGVLGLLSKSKDIELAKLQQAHELDMTRLNMEAAKLAQAGEANLADLASLKSAVEADKATYGDSLLGRIVDFARGMVRPLITYCAFGIIVWTTAHSINMDDKEAISEVVSLCAIPIGYWFGSRFATRKGRQ
jgi:hypothetical protein